MLDILSAGWAVGDTEKWTRHESGCYSHVPFRPVFPYLSAPSPSDREVCSQGETITAGELCASSGTHITRNFLVCCFSLRIFFFPGQQDDEVKCDFHI